jgi:Homeodomain-like domain
MDRDQLEAWLDEGLSLIEIGELTGRDPSTVGYWCRKLGLAPNGRTKHAAKGALSREQLEPLIAAELSTREIAEQLERSQSTIRHWLNRYGLRTLRQRRMFNGPKPKEITSRCRHHGLTKFVLEGRNAYRCAKCRSAAVTAWRRRVKRQLVEARGGACEMCGFSGSIGALHFHHLDPNGKEFAVSNKGGTIAFARLQAEADKCMLLCQLPRCDRVGSR